MSYLAAILATACFAATIRRTGVLCEAHRALDAGRHAADVLRDKQLSDAAKERAIRGGALALLMAFVSMLARTAAAAVPAVLVLLAFHTAGLAAFASVLDALTSWTGVVLGSLAMMLTFAAGKR